MLIRPAVPADVPAVLPMVNQICALHESWDPAKYGFLPNPAQRYERWLIQQAKSDRSVFLVAELEAAESNETGLLTGFLIGTVEEELPIYRLDKYGFIHDLWVEPDYRSAGVGWQLVKTAQQRFAHLGVKQIRLDTALANESARCLFQSCGFRISTIEMLSEL